MLYSTSPNILLFLVTCMRVIKGILTKDFF